MSDRIYLVRHGEAAASWGQSADPGLSELGRQQAVDAGADLQVLLAGATPTLLSSPLARAQETAEPVAESLSLDVRIDQRVREVPSPVPLAERQNWLRGFMQGRWDEQSHDLHQWRDQALAAVLECPPSTVMFSHFLVINALVGLCERCEQTLVFYPANGSITVLNRDARTISVERLGAEMESLVN